MKNTKKEDWRNQTLVNRVNADFTIATEYYNLVQFVVENYTQRFEVVQNPLLYLMSHCIELRYKDTLLFAIENYPNCAFTKESLIHSHDLSDLCAKFVELCGIILNDTNISDEDKTLISQTIITNNKKLTNILQANTTSYRYANVLSRKGEVKGKGSPISTDNESPNIKEIYPLFTDCNTSIVYIIYMIENLKAYRESLVAIKDENNNI